MSFVTVPEFFFPDLPATVAAAPSLSGAATMDLNGASQWVAFVFAAPRTVSVDCTFFRINSATTGCGATVRIETVDTATGLPTGTLAHANAAQSVTIGTGAANYEVIFPGAFTLTKGTLYALYVGVASGTPSAVNFATFSDDGSDIVFPYVLDFDASAAIRDSISPVMGVGVAGGSALILEKAWPVATMGNDSYGSTATPDTVGNQVTLAAPMRISGLWAWVDLDGPANVHLYDSDGVTVLATAEAYTNVPPVATQGANLFHFASSIELEAGTYYAAIEATGATIALGVMTFTSDKWRQGSPHGGAAFAHASCTQTPSGVGSWTVTNTKQAFVGLIVDGISSGGGGTAGGRRPKIQILS